eukprot:5466508-Pleurochrysis_carterae.AAC.4
MLSALRVSREVALALYFRVAVSVSQRATFLRLNSSSSLPVASSSAPSARPTQLRVSDLLSQQHWHA